MGALCSSFADWPDVTAMDEHGLKLHIYRAPVLSDWAEQRLKALHHGVFVWTARTAARGLRHGFYDSGEAAAVAIDQIGHVRGLAQSLSAAMRNLKPDAAACIDADPLASESSSLFNLPAMCDSVAGRCGAALAELSPFTRRGRRQSRLSELVEFVAQHFELLDVEVSAKPAGTFFQVINIVWAEVAGREEGVTPDALRKALSRRKRTE